MKITKLLADEAILVEIGQRIAHRRLSLQLTQADVAEQAGVAKRTVERIEAGASAQLLSIVRIFRVLDLLPDFEQIIPAASPSPMELLQGKRKIRQRAAKNRRPDAPAAPWTWDDKS